MAADGVSIIDRVYASLVRLCARTGRPAGKDAVHRALACPDVTPSQVYEALRSLRVLGRIEGAGHGFFEPPAEATQDRAMSFTDIPGGRVKFEIDDKLIEFTPGEWRRLALYAAGHVLHEPRTKMAAT